MAQLVLWLALCLALAACGKYGPLVRTHEEPVRAAPASSDPNARAAPASPAQHPAPAPAPAPAPQVQQ